MTEYHKSVLLQEAVDALQIKKSGKYIDATLGAGGHSFEIVRKGGTVLAIDQDNEAIQFVEEELRIKNQELRNNITLVQGNFSHIGEIARENGFGMVAGILFDVGVSSHHLDANERGFSFQSTGPLDMRMDTTLQVRAADLVNGLNKGELIDLFTKYGEEPFARRIAEAIVTARVIKPFENTTELAELITRSVKQIGKIHPATRVFQALRIAVNDELISLEEGLIQAVDLLETKGRLVVITFHSLEDRIVKRTYEKFKEQGLGEIITDKPIIPTDSEIERNKRARSAKMRVFEKI